ncbi:35516_t:CDS:2 [Gigaspora margarita]|uniref:35516_t:CDS:1 n=1 Tax=Gigaspora margarita TaxID=4874 RepID=A0ABN7UHC4_GIGMA|nr:35516_t:CDS:2 [Gigaspora margarita]
MSSNQKTYCRKETLSTSAIMYNKTNNIENIVENIIVKDENDCVSTDHEDICSSVDELIQQLRTDLKQTRELITALESRLKLTEQTSQLVLGELKHLTEQEICTSLQTLINDAQIALQKKPSNDNFHLSHSPQCLGLPSTRSRSSSRSSNVSNWLMNHYSPANSAWECGCGYCVLCLASDNISIIESRPNSTRTTPRTSRRNSVTSRQKCLNPGNPTIPDIPEENFVNRKQRQLSVIKRLYRYQLEHKSDYKKNDDYSNSSSAYSHDPRIDDDSTPFPSSFGQNIFCNVNIVNNTTKTNNNRTFYSNNNYNNDNSNNNFNTKNNYYHDTVTTNNYYYYSSSSDKDNNKENMISKNVNSISNFPSITKKRFMNLFAIIGILIGILQNGFISSKGNGNLYYKRKLMGGPLLLTIISRALYAKRNNGVRSKKDVIAMIKVIKYVTVLFVGWSVGRMGS